MNRAKNTKKFLLIITGETFRCGPQGTRDRGSNESFDLQKIATNSHLEFISHIKNSYDIDCDIFTNIYELNEDWDNMFYSWYGDFIKYSLTNKTLLGEPALHNKTLKYIKDVINKNEYEFMLFIRPDLYLKKYFFKVFNPKSEKITFAHVNEIEDPLGKSWHKTQNGFPAVNHQIFYVPNIFYNELVDFKLWHNHYSYELIVRNGIPKNNIDFFIHTYHSSSTDVTWNPIFHQVGRNETNFWVDRKYRVDATTHNTIISDDETIYNDLLNNDFKENI